MEGFPKAVRQEKNATPAVERFDPAEDPRAIARKRLDGSSYPALRRLKIEFNEGVLTIGGCVPSFHMRQVAHLLVAKIPEVREVVDRIQVAH